MDTPSSTSHEGSDHEEDPNNPGENDPVPSTSGAGATAGAAAATRCSLPPQQECKPIICGKADNKAIFTQAFTRWTPYWLGALRLRKLDMKPFVAGAEWAEPGLMKLVSVLVKGRMRRGQLSGEDIRMTLAVAEALWPNISETWQLKDTATARAELTMDILAFFPISSSGLGKASLAYNNARAADGALSGAFFETLPKDAVSQPSGAIPLEVLISFCQWVAEITELPTCDVDFVATCVIAAAKKGFLSRRFLTTEVEADWGVTRNLNVDVIRSIWTNLGHFFQGETAEDSMKRWLSFLPPSAIRTRLALHKIAGENLTGYATIVKAMRLYKSFPWEKVASILPDEWAKFEDAVRIIGNNRYYGLGTNLGEVTHLRYKSIGYVAKELLVRVNGETTLAKFPGWTRAPKNMLALDTLVNTFIQELSAVGGGDYTFDATRVHKYVDLVKDINFADM